MCELEHDIKYFPSLPKDKEVFQASTVDIKHACFILQKKSWKPHIPSMNSEPTPLNSWNTVNNQFPPQ